MLIINDEKLNNATLVETLKNKPEEKTRVLQNAFPNKDVFDIDVIYNEINNAGIVAGSIIGFDASTPLRNKEALQAHMASLTKISGAYYYTESELYRYANPRRKEEPGQIVNEVIRNLGRLYEGNEDTKELIRAKLTYEGRLEYKDEKTNVEIAFDYDMPEGSIVERDVYSNPLEALENEVQAFMERNGNQRPEVISMNSRTYRKLKNNETVKLNVNGDLNRVVTNGQMEALFADLDLPEIVIDDGVTVIEGKETNTTVQHLVDDKIVLRFKDLGETFIGPALVDNEFVQGMFTQSVLSTDPEGQKTIVGEVTMPVLKNKNGVHIINITEEVPEG